MQKKVIALAVAGLVSGAAFAQSNVTVYGVADAGYVYGSGDRQGAANKNLNFSGIQSGLLAGSRIGFKGEEGLGNGLKAVFTLEYALQIDADAGVGSTGATGNNIGGTNARQQFVGLEHNKLGTVALGMQYAPAFYASGRNDAFMSSTGIGSLARLTLVGDNSISGTNPARWTNSVTYTSPTWSGFSVRAAYGFGENASELTTVASGNGNGISRGDNGKFGVGGNYANGPLNLDLVYQSRQGVRTATSGVTASATTGDSINEWYLGGSYDFKVVKISGSYQDKSDSNGTSATEFGNNIWQVGASVPVFGNGKFYAGYSRLSQDRTASGNIKAWNLMYSHSLSKRTTLYTGVTQFDNDNNSIVAASNSTVGAIGEKNITYAAGMNHTF
jgi:predicted porin